MKSLLLSLAGHRAGRGTLTSRPPEVRPADFDRRTWYRPFGQTVKAEINKEDKYGYTGQELDDGPDIEWYYYGARYYDPRLRIFTSVDPSASLAPGWGPYAYTKNNPIRYIDPNGKWEVQVQGSEGEKYATIEWQEDDDIYTLSQQTGISVDDIRSYYEDNAALLADMEAGARVSLTTFGGHLSGINQALNHDVLERCNCWGSALKYGLYGYVDEYAGLDRPGDADYLLTFWFTETAEPQWGDVIRYAEPYGYKGTLAPSNTLRYSASFDGSHPNGTSHFANFLLTNATGTQVLTKNGWFSGWAVQYEYKLPQEYGDRTGIYGGSPIFTR